MQRYGRQPGAGDLPHRVTVQQNTPTRSSSGQEVASWSTFVQRWAAIFMESTREVYRARQVMADTTVVMLMRGHMAVTPKMRVSHSGRLYDILGVESLDGKAPAQADWLHLLCREGASQGN